MNAAGDACMHVGTHLPPAEFHAALANPNAVVIDVRNFNETLIGKFAPPPTAEGADKVLTTHNRSG